MAKFISPVFCANKFARLHRNRHINSRVCIAIVAQIRASALMTGGGAELRERLAQVGKPCGPDDRGRCPAIAQQPAVKRPTLGEDARALNLADEIGVASCDRELKKMTWHRLVSAGRPDAIAVEVFVRVEAFGRVLERRRRGYEIEAIDLGRK